jgi:hypothetical protein
VASLDIEDLSDKNTENLDSYDPYVQGNEPYQRSRLSKR